MKGTHQLVAFTKQQLFIAVLVATILTVSHARFTAGTAAEAEREATVRCSRGTTAANCAKAGRDCAWCTGNNMCYSQKFQTCCLGNTTVCTDATETCCVSETNTGAPPMFGTCCKKSTAASCCPITYPGPQCCTGNATCCRLAGPAGNMKCCSGYCLSGFCCANPVVCKKPDGQPGATCCGEELCYQGNCLVPPEPQN